MKKQKIKKYLSPYWIYGRASTSMNYSFAAAMAPAHAYDEEQVDAMLRTLDQDPDVELSCVYCDRPATTWDHLFGVVKDKVFSGNGHVLGNLVPSCSRCNGAKGNKDWHEFVNATVPEPTRTAVIDRIDRMRASFPVGPEPLGVLNDAEWERVDAIRRSIHELMRLADDIVAEARARSIATGGTGPRGPDNDRSGGRAENCVVADQRRLVFHGILAHPALSHLKLNALDRTHSYQTLFSRAFGQFWINFTPRELQVRCYLFTTLAVEDKGLFNCEVLDLLKAQEEVIEAELGEELVWDSVAGRQACWVGMVRPIPDIGTETGRADAIEWAGERASRLIASMESRATDAAQLVGGR